MAHSATLYQSYRSCLPAHNTLSPHLSYITNNNPSSPWLIHNRTPATSAYIARMSKQGGPGDGSTSEKSTSKSWHSKFACTTQFLGKKTASGRAIIAALICVTAVIAFVIVFLNKIIAILQVIVHRGLLVENQDDQRDASFDTKSATRKAIS